jgi:hypothetical protein
VQTCKVSCRCGGAEAGRQQRRRAKESSCWRWKAHRRTGAAQRRPATPECRVARAWQQHSGSTPAAPAPNFSSWRRRPPKPRRRRAHGVLAVLHVLARARRPSPSTEQPKLADTTASSEEPPTATAHLAVRVTALEAHAGRERRDYISVVSLRSAALWEQPRVAGLHASKVPAWERCGVLHARPPALLRVRRRLASSPHALSTPPHPHDRHDPLLSHPHRS